MFIEICKKNRNSDTDPSDFALMITKMLYSISILYFASLFAASLFDIRNYIEDHNSVFEYFELLVLLGFIFSYYAPWLFFVVVSQKGWKEIECPWKISILTSIIYAILVYYFVSFSWDMPNNIQKGLLLKSLLNYLIYMFTVNIMLSLNDGIERFLEELIDAYLVPIIFRSNIE